MNYFYAWIVAALLVILGGKSPKIALSVAALILLSTVIINKEKFAKLLDQKTYQ